MIEEIVIYRRAFSRWTESTRLRLPRAGLAASGSLLFTLAVCILFWSSIARGLDGLKLELDGLNGAGWSTGPVRLQIDSRGSQGFGFEFDVQGVQLPAPLNKLKRIQIRCAEGLWSQGHIRCHQADVLPYLEAQPGTPLVLAIDYALDSGRFQLKGQRLAIAGGRLNLDLVLEAGGGRGSIDGENLEIVQLAQLAAWLNPKHPLADYQPGAGRLDLKLDFDSGSVDTGSNGQFNAQADIRDLEFSDSAGLHAGEGVRLGLTVKASSQSSIWNFDATGTLHEGSIYLDPLFTQVSGGALELTARGRRNPGRSIDIEHFSFSHPQVMKFSGAGRWLENPGPGLDSLKLLLPQVSLAPIYAHYLQAFTGAGALSDLAVEGRLGLALNWQAGGDSSLDIQIKDLAVGDNSGLFALIGLDGDLHWYSGTEGPASRLVWSNAQIYRLDLGSGSMDLAFKDRDLDLLAPLKLEILAGTLKVPSLKVRDLGLQSMDLEMGVALEGIDLGELGNTLAWVPLSGQLSARIPALRFRNGRMTVVGAIEMSLFDGQASISGLSLENPFGLVPRLGADIGFQNLSLDLLSRSFSFGAIEGRLEGHINNLILDGWQPVSFDARIETPPDDRSRHRISQRAVDNLASLGGANAVLSSTFLRFFSSFSYQRLGLRCRLRAGVCEMGGVAPASQGYYIVEGGGIPPRVDVVGYNRRVNWQTLLGRLRAINQLDEVVVQ